MVSIDDLQEVTHGLFKEPIIGTLKSKMLRSVILKIDMTSFFSAEGGPIWIKFRRLVQNEIWTAVMWSKSKPDVEFQYGGRLGEFNGMSSQSYLPHCRVLPLGEFNVMIPKLRSHCRVLPACHRANSMAWHPRATYHMAGCCHLVNSPSRFQSHMPHFRVQSPDEINFVIVPHCRV